MLNVELTNIAGIQKGNTQFEEGVNIVQASNFEGKSNLIAGLRTVTGLTTLDMESHHLREGESHGSVRMWNSDLDSTVELSRSNGIINLQGEPLLTDRAQLTAVRLFAFLDENNPLRFAIRSGDHDLMTDLILSPLEFENIDTKVKQLETERRDIEQEISNIENNLNRIPQVKEEITTHKETLQELQEKKEKLQEKVQEDKDQEKLRSRISGLRNQIDTKERRVKQLQSGIQRRKERIVKKKETLQEIQDQEITVPDENIADIKEEISTLESQANLIDDIVHSNSRVLDEGLTPVVSTVEHSISGDNFDCWVCGNSTTEENILQNLDQLREVADNLRDQQTELEEEIEDIKEQQRKQREHQRTKESLEEEIQDLQLQVEEDEASLEDVEQQLSDLKSELDTVQEQYNEKQDEIQDELARVEQEIGSQKSEIADLQQELDQLEVDESSLESLREQKKELSEEIESLRRRKERVQMEFKDEFDAAIDDIVSRFIPGFDGARLDRITTADGKTKRFELKIARGGSETTVENLSEGELELLRIAVGLAGYRAYDVDEYFDIIAFDGIGELAAENLKKLIEYVKSQATYIIVTAHPEDGDFETNVVTPNDWDTQSQMGVA